MIKIKKFSLSIFHIACWLPSLTYAANPSVTTVSVTVPALVQISGLSNIALTPANFSSPATGSTTACIYTNVISPLGSYYVTAASANPTTGVFRVTNGSAFVPYSVFWNANSSPTQTLALSSGTKTVQQLGGNGSSLTCAGTPNANLNISFSSAQITGALAGTYTDTISVVISPS